MDKKLIVTVTGGEDEEREILLGFLQASFRRLGVVPSMEVANPGAVMTRGADELGLSQDLAKFPDSGISIKLTDELSADAAAKVLLGPNAYVEEAEIVVAAGVDVSNPRTTTAEHVVAADTATAAVVNNPKIKGAS